MGVYTCDNCPHQDIMFCHNCTNEGSSPLLHSHPEPAGDDSSDEVSPYANLLLVNKINEPHNGSKRFLVIGHCGSYINEIVDASSVKSAVLWFYKTFTRECSIVNIIEL